MTTITMLPDRAVLEVAGPDRVPFLQGLVSNDVAQAAPGRAVWAALLTPQGKWLADFFIHADGDRLLLDVEAARAGLLVQKLTRYRLRAKVSVAPVPMVVHAGWAGPDPRLPAAGWRVVGTAPFELTATPEDYDLHRLRLGLPGPQDMEPEKTTLLEAGFADLNGVSWTKGCYMGQELTARTKYRGLLKRRLVRVRIDGPLPPWGTPAFDGEAEVGAMRSGRGETGRSGVGLALLRVEAGEADALQCGDAILAPSRPDWMSDAA